MGGIDQTFFKCRKMKVLYRQKVELFVLTVFIGRRTIPFIAFNTSLVM